MYNEPTMDEKLYMCKKCDLKVNINAKDEIYNIKLIDNSKIVSTDFIPKNQIICISDPLFNFNFSNKTKNLLASLLDEDEQLINRYCDYFYLRDKNDIIKGFKDMYGDLDQDLISKLMKQPIHMIQLYVKYNNFSILKRRYLYILASKFNHSCNPNCKWDIIDDQLIITTITDIKSDEECTISYWNTFNIENVLNRKYFRI